MREQKERKKEREAGKQDKKQRDIVNDFFTMKFITYLKNS